MIRAMIPNRTLDIVGWLLVSLLIGALAGRIAKYFGAAVEIRLLAFVVLTGLALAIWHVGRATEAGADAA
jgi:hypothetical protein